MVAAWLPQLPSSWEVERAKCSFREVDDRSANGGEELLSVSHKTGVTLRSEKNVTMFMADSYAGHKLCLPGDVVVNTMWAWMAALGVSDRLGIVSPAYGVYRPRAAKVFEPRFLDYLLRTETYRAEYLRRSRGITTSRLRLYPNDFLEIQIVRPPLGEQRKIVRFLDWHGGKIAKAMRTKQAAIDLIAEERTSLTRDVIRSAGSQTIRLAHAVEVMSRPITREPEELYTAIGLYNRGRGIFHKRPTAGSDLGDSNFNWIEEGELILSGQFAWEGSVAIATSAEVGCIASHRYHALRAMPAVATAAYLWSFLRTDLGHLLLNEHSRGAAGRNRPLNLGTLLKERIPLPPEHEQRRLDAIVARENQLLAKINALRLSLQEFRSGVIESVVFGQLAIPDDAPGMHDADTLQTAAIDCFDEDDEEAMVEETL